MKLAIPNLIGVPTQVADRVVIFVEVEGCEPKQVASLQAVHNQKMGCRS